MGLPEGFADRLTERVFALGKNPSTTFAQLRLNSLVIHAERGRHDEAGGIFDLNTIVVGSDAAR